MTYKISILSLIFFILTHTFSAIVLGILLSLFNGQTTPPIAYASLFFSFVLAFVVVCKIPLTSAPQKDVSPYFVIKLCYWAVLSFLVFVIFWNSFFVLYEDIDNNSIQTLLVNNFGDLPLHIHFIRLISNGVDFWPDSPILAGTPLLYPLSIDFYSALLDCIGIPLHWHLRGVAVVLSLSWLYLLHHVGGPLLVFAFFFNNAFAGLSLDGMGIVPWANFYLALFIPQRSFQLAFPLGLLLLWQFKTFYLTSKWDMARWFGIIVLGVFPLIHFHTFLFILGFLGFRWLYHRDKHLFLSVVIASCLFIPLFLFLTGGGDKASAVRFLSGWLNQGNQTFLFWIKASLPWFAFLVLGLICKFIQKDWKNLDLVYAVFCFLLMNVITVAYWDWDNIKILSWAFLIWVWVLKDYIYIAHHWIIRCVIICVAGGVAVSGGLHLNSFLWKDRVQLYDMREVDRIRGFLEEIPATAIFATDPTHNHPVSFFGHPLLMGHGGHLWSHGISFHDTEAVINKLFLKAGSSNDGDLEQLLRDKGVSYIYYGNRERSRGVLQVTPSMQLVFQAQDVEIYSLEN